MKTLADLKRDLQLGTAVELVKFNSEIAIPERLQGIRYVVKVKSNGVEFNKDKTATKGSFMDYPKATLCEYDGNTLTLYHAGVRELTETEKRILDNRPSRRPENREQVEMEALADFK